MDLALAAFAFAPGLAVGSFLNVLAARIPVRLPVAAARSACLACGEQIAWKDNVPVLSYMLLMGRCRACNAPIGLIYPAVELLTAVLLAACLVAFGLTAKAAVAAFFCAVLVMISAADVRYRIVPNRVVLPAAAAVLAAQTLLEPTPEWALAALGGSLFLFVAAVAYPGGMGMGDVKLALLLGAALGRGVAPALMIAMVAALVPAVVLLARHGQRARKMGIPFAPFLALGGVVALFAGDGLLAAYLGLFD